MSIRETVQLPPMYFLIRTGGSMLQTVDRCYEAGAVGVMVMATHLVLAGNARQRFVERGICCIIGADTYPGRESDDLLQIYSAAPVIADELRGYFRLQAPCSGATL